MCLPSCVNCDTTDTSRSIGVELRGYRGARYAFSAGLGSRQIVVADAKRRTCRSDVDVDAAAIAIVVIVVVIADVDVAVVAIVAANGRVGQ